MSQEKIALLHVTKEKLTTLLQFKGIFYFMRLWELTKLKKSKLITLEYNNKRVIYLNNI